MIKKSLKVYLFYKFNHMANSIRKFFLRCSNENNSIRGLRTALLEDLDVGLSSLAELLNSFKNH